MSDSQKGNNNNNNNNNNNTRKRGVDALLTQSAKQAASSNSISFRLIKGPVTTATADPVDIQAPHQTFPLMAKFPESVQKPNFTALPWQQGRLYQQDIPKPVDDSDDEDEQDGQQQQQQQQQAAVAVGGGGEKQVVQPKKKRWKYNRKNGTNNRQWILQEQVDFLETMVAKREQHNQHKQQDKQQQSAAATATATAVTAKHKISSRYEGVPEHNASRYALILVNHHHHHHHPDGKTEQHNNSSSNHHSTLQIQTLPSPFSTIPFAQPAARHSLSLSQAEQAIQDQRAGISSITRSSSTTTTTTTTLQRRSAVGVGSAQQQQQQQPPGAATAAAITAATTTLRIPSFKNKNDSKHRLLHKLQQKAKYNDGDDDDIDEADDVMGDVTFRNRKGNSGRGGSGSSSKARQELLTTLASDDVMVSEEGVLGGTNDAVFGGRGRFGRRLLNNNSNNNMHDGAAAAGGGAAKEAVTETQERGADGAAMEEDFYQRDVRAEYEELDYDANEQFDDDDVDLGESEVVVDSGGYGDEEEEDELDEMEGEEEAVSGAENLLAGFREMLAQARGEIPTESAAQQRLAKEALRQKQDDSDAASEDGGAAGGGGDHMSKILKAAEEASMAVGKVKSGEQPSAKPAPAASSSAIQVDENGLRIINLEAVRREIWLNHGLISMKRLMKIFDIKKKSSQERQARFRDVVKELCTMKTDPVGGRMLVLKQHYSNMS